MRLDKKALRKMILSEMRSTLIKEDVDPKQFAKHIIESFGDMFKIEGYIDSQIENHVYWELIESGHMTEDNFDFDVLDEVMNHLAKYGVIQEKFYGLGKSAIHQKTTRPGRRSWQMDEPKPAREEVEAEQAKVAAEIVPMLQDLGIKKPLLQVIDRTLSKIATYESVPAAEKKPVSALIDKLGVKNKKIRMMDYHAAALTLQRAIKSMLTQTESRHIRLVDMLFDSKK